MLKKLAAFLTFNSVSLKIRLLLYFLFLVILPTSIISITIYNESYRTITENISAAVQKNLNMVETLFVNKFAEMDSLADSIYMNPEMTELLSAERPVDQIAVVNELTNLDKIIDGYSMPGADNRSYIPKLYMLDRPEYQLYNFSRNISTISEIEKKDWYAALPFKARYTVVGLRTDDSSSGAAPTIMLAKRLYGLNNLTIPYVGLLTIEADIGNFNDVLDQLKPSVNSRIFIIDKAATVVASPDTSLLNQSLSGESYIRRLLPFKAGGSGSFETNIRDKAMLVAYRSIESLDWTIVSVSPVSDLNGKLVYIRKVMYVVIAVCMALALLMALLLSNNITRPIHKFIKSMSYAREGNFDIAIQYKRKDEFTFLFSQYNKMIRQIKELINKLYITEVKKKEAELKALQAQINPHFLYNTLDSINWIALRHKVPEISQMVTSLSDFFRYSLSKGRNIIPIEDELQQVRSYLSIQQVRFKERLDYSIEVEPEVYGHYSVKLILQPLVENSLIHGIEKRRGKGVIALSARRDGDWIVIDIRDNGVGANVEELNDMLRSETGGDSFGLNNVNERIKQVFGPESGLQFRSNDGPGVTVTVKFPCVTSLEGMEDEAEDDHSR